MAAGADRTRRGPPSPGSTKSCTHVYPAHICPAHVHGDWALMPIDRGAVAYHLDGRARLADSTSVTLLPPGVAHDGRAAPGNGGFAKRVAYPDATWLADRLAGRVVDRPDQRAIRRLATAAHDALATPEEEFAAEEAVLAIAGAMRGDGSRMRDAGVAMSLRDLLESNLADSVTLAEAGRIIGAHPNHLSRSFRGEFGVPPHRYLVSRRVDVARRLLLAGRSIATAAAEAGFHDQAHLTRHFQRIVGVTPGAFARSGGL